MALCSFFLEVFFLSLYGLKKRRSNFCLKYGKSNSFSCNFGTFPAILGSVLVPEQPSTNTRNRLRITTRVRTRLELDFRLLLSEQPSTNKRTLIELGYDKSCSIWGRFGSVTHRFTRIRFAVPLVSSGNWYRVCGPFSSQTPTYAPKMVIKTQYCRRAR